MAAFFVMISVIWGSGLLGLFVAEKTIRMLGG